MAKATSGKNAKSKKQTPRKSTARRESTSVAIDVTKVRRLGDDELRLPLWLRGDTLPKYVADHAVKWLTMEGLSSQEAKLTGIVQLALASQSGMLKVLSEHEKKPQAISPEVYIHNVEFVLCRARDDLLMQTPPALSSVVVLRLDKLIDAVKATLAAYMSVPLNKIVCNSRKCKRRGRHLLPGLWIQAAERSTAAATDAMGLLSVISNRSKNNESESSQAYELDVRLVVLNEVDAAVISFLGKQRTSRSRIYIADNLPSDKVSVSHAVSRLIDHNFVEDRGRNVGVAITPAGRAWIDAHQSGPKAPR